MPFDVYSNDPPGVFAHMSQIVLKNAGPHRDGPLGFVDQPLDHPRHQEPTADRMGLRAKYMARDCQWDIGVGGWSGDLSYVIRLQGARNALRAAGCEVINWGDDHALTAHVPNQYCKPGSRPELLQQGKWLVSIVQPFLRVRRRGALEPIFDTGG